MPDSVFDGLPEMGRVCMLDLSNYEVLYEWLDYLIENEFGKILLITRLPPARVLRLCDITMMELMWLTDRKEIGSFEPRLELLNHSLENVVATGEGLIVIDAIEYLIEVHGFDAILSFIRSIVDMLGPSRWRGIITLDSLALNEEKLARLKREIPPIFIPKAVSDNSSEILEDIGIGGPELKPSKSAEIQDYIDLAEDGTPRLIHLTRLPKAGFNLELLRKRILSWRRMGLDVSELEPALKYQDIERSFALYQLVEEKVRVAVEIDRMADKLVELGELSEALKIRFKLRQITGLEEILRSAEFLLSKSR